LASSFLFLEAVFPFLVSLTTASAQALTNLDEFVVKLKKKIW
jgi:hypothetical protein